ncbi:MAG: glycosyl hydrolase family 8 [Patescibacteria group bacterium]|jgi:endo-1,4-beta-D-glucanase Y
MIKKYIGGLFLVAGIIIVLSVWYVNNNFSNKSRPFSSYTLLVSSWERYKEKYINEDGRVIDFFQNNITTSEGQSYAMLRSVFVDDKETFDKVWKWTRENMKRPGDNLLGWKWGLSEDGEYGFLEDGGENSASDAETDIALALVLAKRRWGGNEYQEEAKKILKDLWEFNTDVILGERYLIAGNWARSTSEIVINPSYFSPYAWRIFNEIDEENDWSSLIDPAYDVLSQVGKDPLDKESAVGLPPDWFSINREDGSIKPSTNYGLMSHYSYDAMRVPFRVALDYVWNDEKRAEKYLNESFERLGNYYKANQKLASSYSHDGQPLNHNESPTMYATALAYFLIDNPILADKIYEEKILRLYSNDENSFKDELPYYDQNWLWFGAALYSDYLVEFS